MKLRSLGLAFLLFTAPAAAGEVGQDQSLKCDAGPVQRTFGGSRWSIFGCSDKTTLVIAAEKDNPAAPFYFIFHRRNGAYELYGEGAGKKEYTKAAFEEI